MFDGWVDGSLGKEWIFKLKARWIHYREFQMRMPRKKEGTKPYDNLWSLNGVVKMRTHLNRVIPFHKIII